MNDLDNELRGAMADLAAEAPSSHDLLAAVHRRGRADRRRRLTTVVAAIAVLAVVGGASVVALVSRDPGDRREQQRLQVATPAGSSETAPPSPVDVGWLPDGFPKPSVRLLGPNAWGLDTRREEGLAALQVQIMPAEPDARTEPGTLSPVSVGGAVGSLYWVPTHAPGVPPYGNRPPEAEGPYGELIFQRRPGQWIRIIVQNSAGAVDLGITQADLVRIGTGLVDRERALPDAIRLGLLPGHVVWGQLKNQDYGVWADFVDADLPDRPVDRNEQPNGHNGSVQSQVSVAILPEDALEIAGLGQSGPPPTEDPDGDGLVEREVEPPSIPAEGKVFEQDGRRIALYRLRSNPKLVVYVVAKPSFGMADEDLLTVAASVRIGPDAAVKPAR